MRKKGLRSFWIEFGCKMVGMRKRRGKGGNAVKKKKKKKERK
jgi:hypothetical protein